MPSATPLQPTLNAGEWSPLLKGHAYLEGYDVAAESVENWIPMIQGPDIKRPGTPFVAEVKDSSSRTWRMPFVRSRSIKYQIEFGDLYCRFYTSRGLLLTGSTAAVTAAVQANPVVITTASAHGYAAGQQIYITGIGGMTELNGRWFRVGNPTSTTLELQNMWGSNVDGTTYSAYTSGGAIDRPYEITSPYSAAALTAADGEFALDYEQSADVIYITDRSGLLKPRRLTRTSSDTFAFSEVDPAGGPFLDLNATSTTLYASAATGSVTIIADASTFTADHVGALIRIERDDLDGLDPWKSATSYTSGDVVRSEGHEYSATNSATSGTTIPSHTRGRAADGAGGVTWEYRNSGYGVARITGYTSATEVTATVLQEFPSNVVGSSNTSELWQLGAWSPAEGYPKVVSFFGARLAFGKEQRVDISAPDDYENFAPDEFGEVSAKSAVSLTVNSSTANEITALASTGDKLIALTEGAEFVIDKQTDNEAFGPDNVQQREQSTEGARPQKPLRIAGATLFTDNAGRLLEILYRFEIDGLDTRDLMVRAEHLKDDPPIRLAYQQAPHRTIWAVRKGGGLCSFAYDRDQNVMAWTRHILGGTDVAVEDVTVIPSPDGTRDDVWLTIRRTINGATKRYVEYIAEDFRSGDDVALAAYSDSCTTYNGAATSTVGGLYHLEGETVQVWADGATHPDRTVSDGAIELQAPASKVVRGLGYSADYVGMPLNLATNEGPGLSKKKKVDNVAFLVGNTIGGEAGPSLNRLSEIRQLNDRDPATPMGDGPPLVSGWVIHPWSDGEWTTEQQICFRHAIPAPATLLAISPSVTTQDRRTSA